MSLRFKISAAMVVILCVAVAALGWLSVSQQEEVLYREMEKRAEVLVRHIAGEGKRALLSKNDLNLHAEIRELSETPNVLYAMVLDRRGRVLVHSSLKQKGRILSGPIDQPALRAKSLLFQYVRHGGEPVIDAAFPITTKFGEKEVRIGTARIGLSQAALIAAIEKQKRSFITVSSVFVLLGAALAFIFGGLLARQLAILTAAMKKVARGELDQMVPISSGDEIGRLAGVFNDMILKLREKIHMEKYISGSTMQLIKKIRGGGRLELGGERRYIVVLFSDIRGFTQMTESMSPEEVVHFLNIYLNLQAEVIRQRGGAVDKFVGDEIMAVFTGEDAELNAARAAVEIQDFVGSLNASRRRAGRRQVRVGIGLNAGEAVMGNMGSQRQMDYTVIGDTVNVAAKLCDAAEPGRIIISRAVYEPLEEECAAEELAPLRVKGKKAPLKVYKLLSMKHAVRKYLRKEVSIEASYILTGVSERTRPALIQDIGLGGCSIEIFESIRIGSKLELVLKLKALDSMRKMPALVRYRRKREDRYLVGLVFNDLSPEVEEQLSEYVYSVEAE